MIKVEKIEEVCKLNYITLKKIYYVQKGRKKVWEIAQMYDSVAILIYHKDRKSFVLVKQFRPAIYVKNGDGYTYELCAGICDKDIPNIEIAKEEILEECGYEVKSENIEKITSFYTSVGSGGAKQELFYVEVDDSMKVSEGGGIDLEDIEVIYLDVDKLNEFIFDESRVKTTGLMFAFKWWESRNC